jgi:hypothetical protein
MTKRIDPAVAEAAKQERAERDKVLKAAIIAEIQSALSECRMFGERMVWPDPQSDGFQININATVPREVAERWAK